LIRHYGGRIFAFDHPSLYHSPRENADQFYEMLPATANLELDVVTHSRGGLVARELIERQRDNSTRGPQVLIGKAVFISAPHVGTKLADGNHTTSLLDAYTNLLTELPDDAFSFTIEGVLALVKIAAHGALAGLPGLNCMLPTGDYLKGLNIDSRYQTKYYAAAADFKPQGAGLAGRFAAFVKGGFFFSIFGEENDGVVPTRGCYDGVPQLGSFPVPAERRLMFGPEDNVHHCNIVAHPELSNHLIKWLLS
ncbi:MAG: esterase/lipase family protein, partial [Blastocatellia bacterium]